MDDMDLFCNLSPDSTKLVAVLQVLSNLKVLDLSLSLIQSLFFVLSDLEVLDLSLSLIKNLSLIETPQFFEFVNVERLVHHWKSTGVCVLKSCARKLIL